MHSPRTTMRHRSDAPISTIALAIAALAVAFLFASRPGGAAPSSKSLASEELGTGSPAVVLIHSIGGDRSDWRRVAPLLALRHRVILVDLPGHGQSASPADAPTVAGTAAALARTLSERKVENALLVGHSYGALVALQTALDQPKRARAVVAIDASTYTPADSARLAVAAQVLRERYTVFLSAVYGMMSNDPLQGDSLMDRAMRVPQPVLTGYFQDSWREDLRPRMRKLKTPVYVVATETLWPAGESWSSARVRLGYETGGPALGYRVAASGH